MMAPKTTPTRESINHEKVVEDAVEARLERINKKGLEWKSGQICKMMVLKMVEDAEMESSWKLEMVRAIVTGLAWRTQSQSSGGSCASRSP